MPQGIHMMIDASPCRRAPFNPVYPHGAGENIRQVARSVLK
ncbi:MAG TPA: hypothetical protein VHI13_06205 [Candidatus Kapabacteria bacterium]|nr:hypothetical protein [Candidatus Kapabacteria bacterium]